MTNDKGVDSKIWHIENVLECEIIKRLNRFVVNIKIKGWSHRAWINNTGRLHEFLVTDTKGFCIRNVKGKKTAYRLFSIQEQDSGAIIDTQFQMKAFEKSFEMGSLPWANGWTMVKRNAQLGESLIDYLLESKKNQIYLEVKSAVLRQKQYAMYPDCPSSRGRKHIQELMGHVKKGGKSVLLFVAALPKVHAFKPNRDGDSRLYRLLCDASKAGMDVKAMSIYYNPIDSFIYLSNPNLQVTL